MVKTIAWPLPLILPLPPITADATQPRPGSLRLRLALSYAQTMARSWLTLTVMGMSKLAGISFTCILAKRIAYLLAHGWKLMIASVTHHAKAVSPLAPICTS